MVYIGLKEFIERLRHQGKLFSNEFPLHCFSVQVTKSNPSYIFPEAIPPMERILPMIIQTTVLFPHRNSHVGRAFLPFSNQMITNLRCSNFDFYIESINFLLTILYHMAASISRFIFLPIVYQSTSNQNLKSQCKSPAELPTITMHPS